MRPFLGLYVAAMIVAALAMIAFAPYAWADGSTYQPLVLAVLVVLCVLGEHVTFQVHSGWTTHASTAPHLAAAFLLPPGLASAVAAVASIAYALNRRTAPLKAAFNTASMALSVGMSALLVSALGGTDVLIEPGWRGLVVAILACCLYYLVSVITVGIVVAIDQRRSFLQVVRSKVGLKVLIEISLGLVGAAFATLLIAAPAFAPALAAPAMLVYFAKRTIDRATAQARNLTLTNTVGRAVAGTLNLKEAFDAIADLDVRDALRLDGLALLPLREPPSFEPRVAADRDQPRLRDVLAQRVSEGQSRIHFERPGGIPPDWIDARNADVCLVAVATPCRVAGAPPRGALVAWRSAPSREPFTDGELLLLDTLADYAAVAIETTRLFDEAVSRRNDAEQRERRIQAVMTNVADGLLTFDAEGVIKSANPAAERIFGQPAESLKGQAVSGLMPELAGTPDRAMSPDADSGDVIKREVSFLRADASRVPIEVSITSIRQADPPLFIAVVRDISERRAFEQQLRHMAFHDALTGLPNRALFMDRIEHALRVASDRGGSVGLLFLDLDNFKVVNDSLGHAIGDELLVKIANRLKTSLGPGPTLARFGGDEFTVLLDHASGDATPDEMAGRLRVAMERPFIVAGRDVFATLSIGIAVSSRGGESAGDLLRNADVAMYRAKSGGRARAVVFDQRMDSVAVDRLELETELRGALERSELELHYQPIVELGTARIRDFEALIRWRHPRDGLVSPDRFISLAEETGLIVPIGQWVLETACRQLKTWHNRFGTDDISLSINISARQLQQPDLLSEIVRVLRTNDLPARSLTIEITESLAMRDAAAAAVILGELKQLGVGVAIDDFGTGYSSLSYLHRFPCDVLKIDRSFVSRLGGDRHDHAIVEAIVALAHALDMEVTAEGIETGEQLARLSALRCERGQGYYFSRPVPAHAASELLAQVAFSPLDELPRAA